MKRMRALALFTFLVIIWGGGFVAVKAGLAAIPPVIFAVFRYVIGAVLLVGYVSLVSDYRVPVGRDDWLAVTASTLFMFTLYPIFLFIAQQYVTSAIASVVSALIPLLTPALTLVLLKTEPVHIRDLIGVSLGFLGAVLVVDPTVTNLTGTRVYGLFLLVLAAVVFALGGVIVKRLQPPMPTETLVAWSMSLGTVPLVIVSVLRGEPAITTIQWTGEAVFATLFLGIVVTAIGYVVYFELLEHLSPLEVNLAGYLMPVTAAIGGWIWLNETISLVTITGFLVTFTGFYVMKATELRTTITNLRSFRQPSPDHVTHD